MTTSSATVHAKISSNNAAATASLTTRCPWAPVAKSNLTKRTSPRITHGPLQRLSAIRTAAVTMTTD
eukprot:7992596-Lingulodinium_polyedra.AAC.1